MAARKSGIKQPQIVALGILFGAIAWVGSAAAAADPSALTEQLRYRVSHSVFGDIGTYTNVVQKIGDVTTVNTTAHFLVKMLGIGMHREDAQRTERWQGNRLVSFVGVTRKNGNTTEVKGQANGNGFVINSPLGTITAPASVRPANPWSPECLKSSTMMRVDNGKIEQVRVTGGASTTVAIEGAAVPAREYEIDGSTRYQVWFDQHNIPVKFAVDDDSGKVTFTLER